VSELFDDAETYQQMAAVRNPYGDGTAAQQIVDALMAFID
jgi:UDP-N-acetylglucosamine 2-epimerase